MPKIQANFFLYAEDLERAISFYSKNFNFKHLGNIDEEISDKWAALKLENAIIWLGKNGTSTGLILLIDKNIESFVDGLIKKGVNFVVPEEMKNIRQTSEKIVETDWGKHTWFIDSERNVVMLFEPADG